MKCLEFQEQVSALIDGELPVSLRNGLESHLKECPVCAGVYSRMVVQDVQLKSLASLVDQLNVSERVKARISDRRNLRAAREPWTVWARIPAFVTLVILALGLGNIAGTSLFEILSYHQGDVALEMLVQDNIQYFGDLVVEIGGEENSK